MTNNPATSWSEAEKVRCIRTLGSGYTEEEKNGLRNPDRYFTYDPTTREFTLNGIVATRGKTNGTLPIHNELEASNNLYSSFVVAPSDLSGTHSMTDVTGGEDVCRNYTVDGYSWRTPNQKELALMVSVKNSNGKPLLATDSRYGSRTRFSGDDNARGPYWNWHDTNGFWTTNQSINVGGVNSSNGLNVTVQIRCVRDGQ